jgi:hypothetical protein
MVNIVRRYAYLVCEVHLRASSATPAALIARADCLGTVRPVVAHAGTCCVCSALCRNRII